MLPIEIAAEIRRNGRCWLSHISLRTSASKVENEVTTILGTSLILTELPPDWEFVLSIPDDYSIDEIRRTAAARARMRSRGIPEHRLPR